MSRSTRQYSRMDFIMMAVERSLKTLNGTAVGTHRANPADTVPEPELTGPEVSHSAGLMRVNHTGEICAQALYQAQMVFARNPNIRVTLKEASDEEVDHMVWCRKRLAALDASPSALDPLWFTGAFVFASGFALAGDGWNLGFLEETETQVSKHLASHLEKLPVADLKSRAIVQQMKVDEESHAALAKKAGAFSLPPPIKTLMQKSAGVMTRIAYYV